MLTAPTGSGKTLAAFLCALDGLIADHSLLGKTRVLYISPLKALNNDIRRNLLTPLEALKQHHQQQDLTFPDIHVMTRSGDTSQSDRRKMLRRPPEILITTPESLNLLLSTQSGRALLSDLRTVILDEIHAVISTKRGAHLISAIERLPRLSGEIQRIALSATVKPLETVAQFIGGHQLLDSHPHNPQFRPRPVQLVQASNAKHYALQVVGVLGDEHNTFGESETLSNENKALSDSDKARDDDIDAADKSSSPLSENEKKDFWHPLVEAFSDIINRNQSTLLFTNSRRLCEKMTAKINRTCGHRVAYSHHGSLSREIRAEVELKLKEGELKAIVATNSLELGIDIGALDEVVLVQSPPSISSTIQRLGRAGHGVGQISHGRLFPTHSEDFVQAAALAKAVQEQDIEQIKPIRCPLDVLAQVIVSHCADESWDVDELYNHLRCSYTFHELPRRHYDLIIDMLAGRYADTRIRELKPRLSWDRLDNTLIANKGAVLALYMSGGTIPNRGYYQLRDINGNALIGELDEEFVWEASIGQVFTLGTQHWRVEKITHNDVFVSPGTPKNSAPPFWRAEHGQRDFHLSERIGELLAWAERLLQSGDQQDRDTLLQTLQSDCALDAAAANELSAYLIRQREFTGQALPHRHHMLVEHINSGPGGHAGYQLVLHTGWGGMVNRPYALALEAAWKQTLGEGARLYADDNCIVVQLPQPVESAKMLSLVTDANIEQLLKKRLEGSGFFAARFRESAGRALLLTKTKFNQRLPLWMSRLQAQKLHAAVDQFTDFPILLESWRSCLQDEFDLPHCHQLLAELAAGKISWSETFSATPSPFAMAVSWQQINEYMYMEDRSPDQATSNLREDLLRDVVFSPALRPFISEDINSQFTLKRQRLSPGYSPGSARELLDWIKERVLLPGSEWVDLCAAVKRDHALNADELEQQLSDRLCFIDIDVNQHRQQITLLCAVEMLHQILAGLYDVENVAELPAHIQLRALATNASLQLADYQHNQHSQWHNTDALQFSTQAVAQWLSFYGPVNMQWIADTLVLPIAKLTGILDDLLENQTIISGHLLQHSDQQQLCDAENFETLLRLQRICATPSFTALPAQSLPLFIAERQGLINTDDSIDGVYRIIETLRGVALPAAMWEQSVLPARIRHYDPTWLDSLMQEQEFYWLGSQSTKGKSSRSGGSRAHHIAFYFDDEKTLWSDQFIPTATEDLQQNNNESTIEQQRENAIVSILQQTGGLDFYQLMSQLGRDADNSITAQKSAEPMQPPTTQQLSDTLWQLVWSGKISNDSYTALRKGISTQFSIEPLRQTAARSSRRKTLARPSRHQLARRQGSLPFVGRWFCLSETSENHNETIDNQDLLEQEENAKDKARILLERYGVVCRALLFREGNAFNWREIFRALRLMELAGEVLAGQFFSDVPGPQFISHEALRQLQKPLPEQSVFWLNATDPASLCGAPIDILKANLPKRVATTELVYCGQELLIIAERSGKSLHILIAPDDPRLTQAFGFFHSRLQRHFQPDKRIVIETINQQNANRSPYLDSLKLGFDVWVDHKHVVLQRRYSL